MSNVSTDPKVAQEASRQWFLSLGHSPLVAWGMSRNTVIRPIIEWLWNREWKRMGGSGFDA